MANNKISFLRLNSRWELTGSGGLYLPGHAYIQTIMKEFGQKLAISFFRVFFDHLDVALLVLLPLLYRFY